LRTSIAAALFAVCFMTVGSPVAAQSNPLPFLNNPVVPAAAVPGGPAFTLTVNGAGFVNGATVLWGGSARVTTFVSATKLTAAILATDIAAENIVVVTVSNPGPGGGVSNAVLFSVTTPATTIAFSAESTNIFFNYVDEPTGLVAQPNPADGVAVLAISNAQCSVVANCSLDAGTIAILSSDEPGGLFNRDIEDSPQTIVGGDFNGDGILDYITLGTAFNPMTSFSLWTALGESGAAAIQTLSPLNLPAEASASPAPVAGDFNHDGHLDVVISGQSLVYFLPGNGDGTFGTAVSSPTESAATGGMVAGDFNGDGILDLAVTNPRLGTVSILIGNGDGSFKAAVDYGTGASPGAVVAGDFNGDGKLDLAVLDGTGTTVSILLGNADGTFQTHVEYPAGISTFGMTLGDFNGDGIVDLAISDTQCTNSGCPTSGSVNFLLGNGNGTFQSQVDIAVGSEPEYLGTTTQGFNPTAPVGRAGFAVADYLDNAVLLFASVASPSGNPVPSISNLSPANAIEQSGAFTLTVNGSNFVSSTTVSFNGQTEPTTFVSASQVTAAIPASAIQTSGNVVVQAVSPAPGGGESSSVFGILLLAPTISAISPSSAILGSPGFTLTITGTNFVNGSTVNFNASSRAATFINSTQLTVTVMASDVQNQGSVNISVTNPFAVNDGGGGSSASLALSVLPTNTQPAIASLFPSGALVGGAAFTLQITGSGFGPSSTVAFGGSAVAATYVNPTTLQASIPAGAIASAGTPAVTVSNPGSSPSAGFVFTVSNPVPDVGQLEPTSVPAGSASTQLSVFGGNFVPSSVVQVNGSARPTTYMNAVTLVATLPATDFAHSGTLNITVNTSAPGGGTTGSLPLVVADFNVTPAALGQTVTAGQAANYSLSFSAANGTLAESVTFSASGLPAGASASFLPSSLTPGSASTTVMLSISTTPHTTTSLMSVLRQRWPKAPLPRWPEIALITVCLLIWRFCSRATPLVPRLALAVLLAVMAGLVACGGSSSGGSSGTQTNPATGTPAGTYTITVNATSSTATVSTKVMLVVQ